MLMTTAKIAPPPRPRHCWPGPERPNPVTEQNRIIGPDQIYKLAEVHEMVSAHGVVVLSDDTSLAQVGGGRNPLPAPAWGLDEFVSVILALTDQDHENAQWCMLSCNRYLDCDSYIINYNRSKKIRSINPLQGIKLYVKFGFIPNASKGVICRLHPAY